jgi:hypothetical protein
MLTGKHNWWGSLLTAFGDMQERIVQSYRVVEVARLRQQLEPLEVGVMQLGERRRPKRRMEDITERQIVYLRNGIAEYERSIVDLLQEIDNA